MGSSPQKFTVSSTSQFHPVGSEPLSPSMKHLFSLNLRIVPCLLIFLLVNSLQSFLVPPSLQGYLVGASLLSFLVGYLHQSPWVLLGSLHLVLGPPSPVAVSSQRPTSTSVFRASPSTLTLGLWSPGTRIQDYLLWIPENKVIWCWKQRFLLRPLAFVLFFVLLNFLGAPPSMPLSTHPVFVCFDFFFFRP